ncbi:unnamed protein product [Colias eurytheme]|nr:unnamed protein product [Colias eurytheme]
MPGRAFPCPGAAECSELTRFNESAAQPRAPSEAGSIPRIAIGFTRTIYAPIELRRYFKSKYNTIKSVTVLVLFSLIASLVVTRLSVVGTDFMEAGSGKGGTLCSDRTTPVAEAVARSISPI